MCLSVNQSPKRIAFLSSKFKLSSDTQIGLIHSASFLHDFPPFCAKTAAFFYLSGHNHNDWVSSPFFMSNILDLYCEPPKYM